MPAIKEKFQTLRAASLVAATTIGAGIFALPYVFERSGFWISSVSLFALGGLLAVAHVAYFRALRVGGSEENLASIVEDVFRSRTIRFLTFLSVVGGLLLALSAYLILGAEFIALIFPVSSTVAMAVFWAICAGPFVLRERHFLSTEFGGAAALFLLLAVLLGYAFVAGDVTRIVGLTAGNFGTPLMAFAPLLFALAGWPAVSEVYAMKREEAHSTRAFERGIIWGTMLAAIAYFVFVVAAVALSPAVKVDTLSGLVSFPWLLGLLAVFGLFAIWTSYLPEGLEIKRSMERGLRIPGSISTLAVIFVPLLLILAGLNQFLAVVTLAGGVFISLQYFFLVLVSRKALHLTGIKAFLLNLVAFFFLAAAIYEIYRFIAG